jgi:glycogen(starch) synthase
VRIIQVTPRFPPAIGGMENHVYAIATELRKRGHEVTVITSDDIDVGKKSIGRNMDVVNGIKVYRYPLLFRRMIREYWFVSGVTRALKNLHADVVHTHGYRCLSSCVAAYWCKRNKVPVILTPHGIYPPRSLGNALIKFAYDYSLGNLLLKLSNKIIALTGNNRQLLLKIGAPKDKVVIIPNGVDTAKYEKVRLNSNVRKRSNSDERVLLYVGRIDWNKGLEKVVEALPMIIKEFGRTRFLIVGPDYAGYSENLLYLARKLRVYNSIVMTGRVSEEELLLYYSMADIFVFPSIYEGLSLSLLEAMAGYIPVVSSKSGGTGDVLVNGVHALLLDDCSPQKIFTHVSTLLHEPKLAKKLQENAFDLVYKKYSWKNVVNKIETLYNEVCNKT